MDLYREPGEALAKRVERCKLEREPGDTNEVRELTGASRTRMRSAGMEVIDVARGVDRLQDFGTASRFHGGQPPEDLARGDPPVDAAAVVADLKAVALDRLDQVEVLRALHAAQHDVADHRRALAERRDGAQLSTLDPAHHAVTARPELHGLASRQSR